VRKYLVGKIFVLETSLHQQLKLLYASDRLRTEVECGGYRIDAVSDDGELIEIQYSSLGALRKKVDHLLRSDRKRRIRIVKPIFACKRVTTLDRPQGKIIRSRMSPKRCDWLELFVDLVHFSAVFPRKRLSLEVLFIEAEEVRVDRLAKRARRKPYRTLDLRLVGIRSSIVLKTTNDLLERLPMNQLPSHFDTSDLATALGKPRWLAQKVAYCLRTMGAIESVQRKKNGHRYRILH
jgi:hypothetical protein